MTAPRARPGAPRPLAQQLLAPLAADPTRPVLTWYDAGGDQRVELSGASLVNAVAKTTGLLVDELGLQPGDRVELALPPHWQLAVWLLATWAASGVPVLGVADDRPPTVVVLGPEPGEPAAAAFARGADEVVAVSLHPFGLPFTKPLPPLVLDHAVAARSHPDQYPTAGLPLGEPALNTADGTVTGEQLLSLAQLRRPPGGWQTHDRVLHTGALDTADDVARALVGPLLAGVGLVWWRNPGADRLVAVVEAERVTVATAPVDGLPPDVRVVSDPPVSS